MLFSPNNDQPFGEQYYGMLGDEDTNPPKHHMAATSPDFFALSPLSANQSCRNHELLHHEEELNPFPPTTNGPPDVDCSRGGYSPSKHANIDDGRYNPNNTAGGQDHELLVEKGGPRNVGSSSGRVAQKRTRVVKKDRHSKIVTAHGPRDRRMRLSLEVARKFFDLQDMLGYDKASKTVEWLMTKSRSAIKSLTRDAKAASSTSECEVTSWVVEDNADDNTIAASSPHQSSLKKPAPTRPKKKKAAARAVPVRKPATQAREWRAMARARARERTWEKLCSRKNMEGSSSPVEESGSREVGPLEEPSSHSFPAADAMADHNSCPPLIFALSSSHGLNAVPNNSFQSHEMIEYYIQQNWEAGDASASLLHVPAAIGPHGGEGTYMSFVRPSPGFSPPS